MCQVWCKVQHPLLPQLVGKGLLYLHFIDEGPQAQRSKITLLRVTQSLKRVSLTARPSCHLQPTSHSVAIYRTPIMYHKLFKMLERQLEGTDEAHIGSAGVFWGGLLGRNYLGDVSWHF